MAGGSTLGKRLWFATLVIIPSVIGIGLSVFMIGYILRSVGPGSSTFDWIRAVLQLGNELLNLLVIAIMLGTLFSWLLFRRRRTK